MCQGYSIISSTLCSISGKNARDEVGKSRLPRCSAMAALGQREGTFVLRVLHSDFIILRYHSTILLSRSLSTPLQARRGGGRDAITATMSLSLSSLLNPSPDPETSDPSQQPPPPASRKDSLPAVQYVHSPEHQFPLSPQSGHHQPTRHYSHHSDSDHEAVQALTALSSSHAPSLSQTQWQSSGITRSTAEVAHAPYEQRPGSSGNSEHIQLPYPSATGRKPSSPTLDQYHVASRSPEMRRASVASPSHAAFTLPPLQGHSHGQSVHQQSSEPAQATQLDHAQLAPPRDHNMGDEASSSPSVIKQEDLATPRASSPTEPSASSAHASNAAAHGLKVERSNSHAHESFANSPLRDSSVPMLSTEIGTPQPANPKKRPPPSKTKKGTATSTKKPPPSKKRKVEPKRSATPSSRTLKPTGAQNGSSKGTPSRASPAPSTRSQSAEIDGEPYEDEEDGDDGDVDIDGDVYCICRKPDNGTFMIGCDGTCDDWYHGKCVGVEERDKNLIDKYVCPNCIKKGAGKTNWKRMCRRIGCRQPARVGKTKGGNDGSKYCSEECGVMYFRDMVGRTRGREEMAKNRSSRRKGSMNNALRPAIDYDLGARGGSLAAGELKSLVTSAQTADEFKRMGDGVLSPPATPSPTSNKVSHFTVGETGALRDIEGKKDAARRKHQLLKDRMKFVTMAKQAAARTATERELKPKEYCGHDSRLEWSDDQFAAWRNTKAGKRAFELETLGVEENEADPTDVDVDLRLPLDYEVCDRKKCARHLEWAKLAVDDVRFEMADNGDRMRMVDKEEREIRETVALRMKTGEGMVESLEVLANGESMDRTQVAANGVLAA